MDDHLTKPINPRELSGILERWSPKAAPSPPEPVLPAAWFGPLGATPVRSRVVFLYTGRFMSKLLEGKLALVLGIANRWSLAYSIAQAFSREGATLVLTYLGDRQKEAIHELSQELNTLSIFPCDVTKEEELSALT